MIKKRIGKSCLSVSVVCMGTMTFGSQCDKPLSMRMMDMAFDNGIDFFDTAELYPVPPNIEYWGRTEEYVGEWLKTKPREQIVIATKIAGPAHGWFAPPVRNYAKTALDRKNIIDAVEGSLKRLQTDYIDLYQTHWPDHGMPYEETLSVFDELIKAGKIRVIGSSNETCWGVMKSLEASKEFNLPRYNSVQNNFSLLNRRCESELAQVLRKEDVSLLPYSPLGAGVLSGKYSGAYPEEARFSRYVNGGKRQRKMADKYVNPRTIALTEKIKEIALENNISPTALSLAWSWQHDFVASTIVGATSIEQMEDWMPGCNYELSPELKRQLNSLEEEIPLAIKEDGLRFL